MDRSPEFAELVVPSAAERQTAAESARLFASKQGALVKMRQRFGGDGRHRQVHYSEAFHFFAQHCGRVEIVRNGELERFYFPVPPMYFHLPKETRVREKRQWCRRTMIAV